MGEVLIYGAYGYKARPDVSLIEVTTGNRNILPVYLAVWLASIRHEHTGRPRGSAADG